MILPYNPNNIIWYIINEILYSNPNMIPFKHDVAFIHTNTQNNITATLASMLDQIN